MGSSQQSFVRQSASDRRLCDRSAGRWFGSAAGLYHYAAKEHGVELRRAFPGQITSCSTFSDGAFCSASVPSIGAKPGSMENGPFAIATTTSATPLVRVSPAATLGWRMVLLDRVEQNQVARLLAPIAWEGFW